MGHLEVQNHFGTGSVRHGPAIRRDDGKVWIWKLEALIKVMKAGANVDVGEYLALAPQPAGWDVAGHALECYQMELREHIPHRDARRLTPLPYRVADLSFHYWS